MRLEKKSPYGVNSYILYVFVGILAFTVGIISQKMGYPHQIKKVLSEIVVPAPNATDATPVHEETKPLDFSVSVEEENFLRQSLIVDPVRVSLNHLRLPENTSGHYRFLATGHVYGDPNTSSGSHPAATWIRFLPEIDQMDLDMIFFMGDIVPKSTADQFEKFEDQVFRHLQIPVFNAVGNHDVEYRSLYEQRYGSSFYTFSHGPAQFIILDTELNACKMGVLQTNFLEASVSKALDDSQISSIFILMHKVLFLDRETLKGLFESGHLKSAPNAQECYLEHDFEAVLSQILLPAADQKHIYLLAGDVGAWGGNLSPFYDELQNSSVSFLAAGIGDSEEDAVLLIEYDQQNVDVGFLRLNGQPFEEFRKFDLDYYQTLTEQK